MQIGYLCIYIVLLTLTWFRFAKLIDSMVRCILVMFAVIMLMLPMLEMAGWYIKESENDKHILQVLSMSKESVESYLFGFAFTPFYHLVFTIKKMEIQLDPANDTTKIIIDKLLKLMFKARLLYITYFLTLLTGSLIHIISAMAGKNVHNDLIIIESCIYGLIFVINTYLVLFFWIMALKYSKNMDEN